MSWFSRLLDLHSDTYKKLHEDDKKIQDCDILIKPEIGEPVFSFVDCVKANPKRFSFTRINTVRMSCRQTYMVKDKQTGEEWRVATDHRMSRKLSCKELQWLTDDEANYLVTEMYSFFTKRRIRFIEIRNIRFERNQLDERKRLRGVYCK